MAEKTENIDNIFTRLLSEKNPEDFKKLMKIYFPVLTQFAMKIVANEAIAKDIVQETFIKFWKSDALFTHEAALKKFLYVSIRNASLNILRTLERDRLKNEKYFARLENIDSEIEIEIIRTELLAMIYEKAEALPKKMKNIFIMHFAEGLTLQEISEKLKISHQTVYNQKYKAVQIIKSQLKKNDLILISGFFISFW
ncbi:MAG: sigma-70 family RNA polymerase sigma factor [Ferruginibacter sp.]